MKQDAGMGLAQHRRVVIGVAGGDSYNDTAMLAEAHAGILFHPPQNVIDEFPQFPVTMNYSELRREIDKASKNI